jgi:hypothetical protein
LYGGIDRKCNAFTQCFEGLRENVFFCLSS